MLCCMKPPDQFDLRSEDKKDRVSAQNAPIIGSFFKKFFIQLIEVHIWYINLTNDAISNDTSQGDDQRASFAMVVASEVGLTVRLFR